MGRSINRLGQVSVIFILVFGVLFFRRTDAFTYPQMWAEDFPIFFQQFEQFGPRCLIMPYGGYLHFVPRLIAIFFGVLKVDYLYLPACYNLSAFFVTFLVALQLWNSAVQVKIRNSVLYAAFFVFLPLWPDIFMTITNVNFITALVLVNFLLFRNTGSRPFHYYLTLLLLLVVSLNGPFSTILSPLVVLIFIVERNQMTIKKALPLAMILMGGIIQGICIKFIDPGFYRGFPGPTESWHLLRFITNNVNRLVFLNRIPEIPDVPRMIICLVVFALFFFVLVRAYRKIAISSKYVLPVTAALFLTAFLVTYWPNESRILAMENARYYFIPYACISWVLILAYDEKIKIWHQLLYVGFFFLHRNGTSFMLPDKHWKQQINEYYQGKRDTIEINPDGWHFTMFKKK